MTVPHIKTPLPGPNAKKIIQQDETYTSPSYTRGYPLVVDKASGCVIEDVDGNLFLDFPDGILVDDVTGRTCNRIQCIH